MMTLSTAMTSLQGQFITKQPIMMAGAALAMIPMMILYFFFQKQFIEGIAFQGSMKS